MTIQELKKFAKAKNLPTCEIINNSGFIDISIQYGRGEREYWFEKLGNSSDRLYFTNTYDILTEESHNRKVDTLRVQEAVKKFFSK